MSVDPHSNLRLTEIPAIETLQVVFKIAERCNINCTYCYYFNMGDTSPMDRPARVSLDTARALARWIAEGCQDLQIPKVLISFHGGEPMLLPPSQFAQICEELSAAIRPVAALSFSIQTNGTIMSDSWLAIFREFGVRVGVSIDGDRPAHDRYRLSVQGRSTFAQTEATLARLVAWADGDPRMMPSTISVLDHRNDYKRIYRFLRSFGVEQMGFLLPDRNWDSVPVGGGKSLRDYGQILIDIFEAWLIEDNPNVHIKYIDRMLAHFTLRRAETIRPKPGPVKEYQVIMARSDGTVAVSDSYTPALHWYLNTPVCQVSQSSLRDFLSHEVFQFIDTMTSSPPSACRACRWQRVCRGGDLENRYSEANGFDNPSVYCDAYKLFYRGVCDLLVENGYPRDLVNRRFGAPL